MARPVAAAGLGGLAADRDQQHQVVQLGEVGRGGVPVVGQPGADPPGQAGQVAVGGGGGDHRGQGAGVGGVVVQLDGQQDLPPGGGQLQVPALQVQPPPFLAGSSRESGSVAETFTGDAAAAARAAASRACAVARFLRTARHPRGLLRPGPASCRTARPSPRPPRPGTWSILAAWAASASASRRGHAGPPRPGRRRSGRPARRARPAARRACPARPAAGPASRPARPAAAAPRRRATAGRRILVIVAVVVPQRLLRASRRRRPATPRPRPRSPPPPRRSARPAARRSRSRTGTRSPLTGDPSTAATCPATAPSAASSVSTCTNSRLISGRCRRMNVRHRLVAGRRPAADHPAAHVIDARRGDLPRRPDPLEIAVEQQRQHHRRVIRRLPLPVGPVRRGEPGQVQLARPPRSPARPGDPAEARTACRPAAGTPDQDEQNGTI